MYLDFASMNTTQKEVTAMRKKMKLLKRPRTLGNIWAYFCDPVPESDLRAVSSVVEMREMKVDSLAHV